MYKETSLERRRELGHNDKICSILGAQINTECLHYCPAKKIKKRKNFLLWYNPAQHEKGGNVPL